jgi:probable phosphoglycerate mutase
MCNMNAHKQGDRPIVASLNPIPFWFLRHGETDWNARSLSQGSTDVPLNAIGIAQARRAALTLADKGIATIVSSPLGRALRTAETVAEAVKLPVSLDADLREVAFGEQEGQPMGDWYDDWIAGTYTPAGAETFAELRERAVAAVNRATALPGPVLVVGHGALFRALRQAMGLEPNLRTPNALPLRMEPPADGAAAWTLIPAELAPAPAG